MARPRKAGLSFYYKDAHEWDDYRIIDLVDTFGPVGFAVYDVIRSEVYKSGYYLELPLPKLALLVMRAVGNRWIEDKSFVLQVVNYCGEIGLFHPALLKKSVITSVEMQRHYADVTARSKADKTRYWLLGTTKKEASPAASFSEPYAPAASVAPAETDKTEEPNVTDVFGEADESIVPIETNAPECDDIAETPDSAEKSGVSAENCGVFAAKMQQRKENKIKQKQIKAKQSKQNQSKSKQSRQKQSKPLSCRPEGDLTNADAAANAAAANASAWDDSANAAAADASAWDDSADTAADIPEWDDSANAAAANAAADIPEWDDFANAAADIPEWDDSANAAADASAWDDFANAAAADASAWDDSANAAAADASAWDDSANTAADIPEWDDSANAAADIPEWDDFADIPAWKHPAYTGNTASVPAWDIATADAGYDDCREIDNALYAVTRRRLTGADRQMIAVLNDEGIPRRFIAQTIRDVGRRNRGPIHSFRYFVPILREAGRDRNERDGRYPYTYDAETIEAILTAEQMAVKVGPDEDYIYDD